MANFDLKKVREVFDAAAELAPPERAALLDQACGSDATLRGEVERLLCAYDEAGEFIEQPALAIFDQSVSEKPPKELTMEMAGQRIGQYKILRELGRGGMGVVFLAERTDGEFHKQVAIKLLPRGAEENEVQRFRRERQILADLEHPNIARLIDGGTLDGQPYVVMEFVEGRNLRELLEEQGALPLERVHAVAGQICAGLEAAHRRGVVHRDIKPENLIITEHDGEARAKILDFGVAKLQQAQASGATMKTHTGMIIGTVSYMSPEQAAGASGEQVDARSDIYSIGIVLYEMLTGQPAFTGDSYLSVLYKHQNEPPVPPHELPAGSKIPFAVSLVILKALAKDRAARQQSAKQLADELEEAFLRNVAPAGARRSWPKALLAAAVVGIVFTVWGIIRWRPDAATLQPASPISQQAFVEPVASPRLQYRVIKKDRTGSEAPLLDDVVLPTEEIHFEITLPFSGNCYLFYENRDGSLIWVNPRPNQPPQIAQAGQVLRVPEGDWIPFGKENPRKQSFIAVYVPDDVLWSLEENVSAVDWDDITDHGPIRAQDAAWMLKFFEAQARSVSFRQMPYGFHVTPLTEAKPRQIIFHRIILWHSKEQVGS